jgi:hypothetical protein
VAMQHLPLFAEYLDGKGDRAAANGLNRDGIPCPSARPPDQNRHRLADGWQGSTIRSILNNPRYTGYAFFGRWTKHETPARSGRRGCGARDPIPSSYPRSDCALAGE